MAFGSFPLDIITSVSPLEVLLPIESLSMNRPSSRSSTRQFHETDHEYTLSLAVPGVSPADLKLVIEEGMLSISGETKVGAQQYSASHRVRVPPDAEAAMAKAVAENGVLSITLPKRPKQTHKIKVGCKNDELPKAAEGDYVVSFPFPGVRPSDFKVVCEDSVLSIAVETNTTQHATRTLKRMRIPGDADVSAAAAAAELGILSIVFPKRAAEAPKEVQAAKNAHRIAVNSGSSGLLAASA